MSAALSLTAGRLTICLGPGGVGKTTIGAALALDAALSGRAVDVMTIDPAPRLLDTLNLQGRPATPHDVALTVLKPRVGGRLRALRLDPKRMFDRLIERYAPSTAARDAILGDRIYRGLSTALAGVADYMAAEQLLDLRQEGVSELIVLDTPPAHEAIDFLDAPRRMLELLSSRALTLLGASREMARGPRGIFDFAARAVLTAFDRLAGLHLLADVQAFVQSLEGMYAGFAERAALAQAMIREPTTTLVLVATAEPQRIEQTREFVSALNRLGLRPGALVINRVMPALPDIEEIHRARLPASLKRKLQRNLADFSALKAREAAWLETMRDLSPNRLPTLIAQDLGREPETLKDLVRIARSIRTAG
uniref:Putative ATPase n=1 Tax=uncultured bacterium CSL144 TaxID=1091570 RepID=G4WVR0_9BACT|nr:putative ATPase [uncultured bacterium CSL144]